MYFTSDNAAPAAPSVMKALIEANESFETSYGNDTWSVRARDMLREQFETECEVFLVSTGTAANGLALAALCPPWGSILCHTEAHIARDECNAPEFYTHGAKLTLVPGSGGKITPETLRAALAEHPDYPVHAALPRALSLTQATESGTVYTADELTALTAIAREAGMRVHMDGARFPNALVRSNASPATMTWRAGVDVLSLGATKGGALAAEAVLLFGEAAGQAEEMAYRRKRGGHLLSKGRLLGAQICGWLEDDAWLTLARTANDRADAVAEALTGAGARLAAPVEANEVFAVLPQALHETLQAKGAKYYDWPSAAMAREATIGDDEILVRFVASWATRDEDIEALTHALR